MRCWEGVARIRSGLVAPGEMEAREKEGRPEGRTVASVSQSKTTDRGWIGLWAVCSKISA